MECVQNIHNQTNQRIYDRNIPSSMLQPYLNVRPVMTKYSFFPIVDPRKPNEVRLQNMPTYNPHSVFNPGNAPAPWSGYNPNIESELRNQIFALQKCTQAVYVPKSTSDLYTYNYVPSKSTQQPQFPQTHALLFEKPSFNPFNPNQNTKNAGVNIFMNATRVQYKEHDS